MIGNVTIIGVGLIGGSLGLAWKRNAAKVRIVGHDEPSVLDRALATGAIDEARDSLADAVADADVTVLAVPVQKMPTMLDSAARFMRSGSIVTDVGSVKSSIVKHARRVLPPEVTFIGGHPMAGSDKGGIDHADAFMFENATYVVCPPDDTPPQAFMDTFAAFLDLLRQTGGRILLLDAERHDRIAAAVSHLPQILAVALMDFVATNNRCDDAFLRLAAGGFRDMTRIASSPFDIWRDILSTNRSPIRDMLAGFTETLARMNSDLDEGHLDALERRFDQARRIRDTIPKNSKGFLHPLADIYVYAEDRPGSLHTITSIMLDAGLNIKDIELLKIREGSGGAFRLSFSDDVTAEAAVKALRESGLTAYRV